MSVSPQERPIQLSDGRILMPDDSIPLADLWEVLPVLLENMGALAPAGANGLAPGQEVPVAGGFRGTPSALPGAMARPGAVRGLGGPAAGAASHGGGGTGFSGVGGGSRGGRGPAGPQGPQGPPGPGTIVPAVKTDGDFTVSSVSPFVAVPGTKIDFVQESAGAVVFFVQAVFGGNSVAGESNGQLGLRIDGVDQPLTANLLHTGAMGVDQFLAGVHASFPRVLAAGSHSVEVVVRGDSSLGAPTGSPITVQANATIPLALTVIHR